MNFELKGRGAFSGKAEGVALVCPESIQGWEGVSDQTGEIIEQGHSQRGQSISGRILVLPCSKGSNGWSCHFHAAKVSGFQPAGWIFSRMDSRAGVAVAVVGVPAASDFMEDPCELIRTGDFVEIDGDTGEVVVRRGGEE
jgi:predicted aconitase with swiveling domain